MGYPQPDANLYMKDGFDYFRLNTLLASAGDIYESEQGALAFALGPDSDISIVTVASFDDQLPNFLNELSVTHTRSFVGKVTVNLADTYPPIQRPGRILIYPSDLWNPQFFPFVAGADRSNSFQVIETPRLDVLEYFTSQPSSVVPARNDREFFYQTLHTRAPSAAGYTFVTVPYYGRRFAKIMFNNQIPANSFDIVAYGVDLQQQQLQSGGGVGDTGSFTPIINPVAYQSIISAVQIIVKSGSTPAAPNSSIVTDGGMFDLLTIGVRSHNGAGGDPYSLKIITSDIPAG